MIYITIGVLATAFSVAWLAPGVRASHPWPVARAMLVSFFEWFGELGLFCSRLVRAALAPPYEGREFVRQMDAVGSQSLPLARLSQTRTLFSHVVGRTSGVDAL